MTIKKWTNEERNYLVDLVEEHGTKWSKIAKLMTKKFGEKYTRDQVRAQWRINPQKTQPVEYKETVEILPDGSHKSDKLLQMTAEQAKDPIYLLEAHGYNPDEWELKSARSNIWNVYSKQDGIQTLYSSKITAKPKKEGLNFDKLLEQIEKVKPFKIEHNIVDVEKKNYWRYPSLTNILEYPTTSIISQHKRES